MREIHVGILGLGAIGKTHLYAYHNMPFFYDHPGFKVKLCGVYNQTYAKAVQNKNDYGFEYAAEYPENIIEDPQIDVVDICLPNFLHEEFAIKALKAGKHVYLEKPAAMDAAGARRIADATAKAGTVNQVVFNNRFYPAVMRAKDLLQTDRLGRIFSFSFIFNHSSNISGEKAMSWRFEKDKCGGGVLFDMGSHVIDLAYWLLGGFESLQAEIQTGWPERKDANGNVCMVEVDDAAYITARLKSGACGTITASKLAAGTNDDLRFEIYGEKGALKFNAMESDYLEYYEHTAPEGSFGGGRGFKKETVQKFISPASIFPAGSVPMGWLRAHTHCLYNFLACVAQGKAASPDVSEALYTQYIMEKAYESAATGRRVTLE